jgi:glycosyltransferase involved in cell wall biosynthesis
VAEQHIAFAEYRDDIPQLMPGCYAGIIASTGWDSFPRSSLEMAAAGLPLLVSDLLGLNEAVEDHSTGLLFTPGDYGQLADRIEFLLDQPVKRDEFSRNAVVRVEQGFTLEIQHQKLLEVIRSQIEN